MGGCNSFCSKSQSISQVQPDTEQMISRSPQSSRKSSNSSSSSSSESKMNNITDIHEAANRSLHEVAMEENVIDEFKQYVKQGNLTMVMLLNDEHPSMHLPKIIFSNGDNCLSAAVRKKRYHVTEYMLQSGISVKYYKHPSILILKTSNFDK